MGSGGKDALEKRLPPRNTSGKGSLEPMGPFRRKAGARGAGRVPGRSAGRGFAHRSAAGPPGGCPGPGHVGHWGRHRACARTAARSDSGPRTAASAGGSRKSGTRCQSLCRVGRVAME